MKAINLKRLEETQLAQAMVADLIGSAYIDEQFNDRFAARGGKPPTSSFGDRFAARGDKLPQGPGFGDRFAARGVIKPDFDFSERFIARGQKGP